MPLDGIPGSPASDLHNIPVSSQFKYLGIQITPRPLDYLNLNLSPLLTRIPDKTKVWARLKLSVVGKINLIKMIFMPQLYILHNSLMVIPLKMFRVITSIFR